MALERERWKRLVLVADKQCLFPATVESASAVVHSRPLDSYLQQNLEFQLLRRSNQFYRLSIQLAT